MKILCTSDLHINDWIPFSTIDEYGRPSRLLDYLKLAEIITSLAVTKNCDAIFIAGDISEAAIQKPMVHDIIGDFLRIVASEVRVYLIHGQHDCSSKEAHAMCENSILKEVCKDLDRVDYIGRPTLVQFKDCKAWFQPWTEGHELDGLNADIFVGHGIVSGCTNLDGYTFINGFKKEDLFEKYRLSIIGDIHKRQEFYSEDNNRVILQPGTPIQNTWKDYNDCGIYIAELKDKNTPPKLEFFSIHDLAPNTFHQFVYDQESTDLIHSRPKVKIKKDDKEIQKSVEITRDNSVIFETCINLINKEENINKEEVIEYLNKVFENTKLSSDKIISKSEILQVEAENFLSINKVSLDFNEFPKSCVIVGHNGSGKTTIPEAIYWCLTGNLTKQVKVDNIINTMNEAEECHVSVSLLINDQKFTIHRSRKGKSGSLTIFDNDNNPIKNSSMRETQNHIYSLLGLQEWQLYMFSYFSAEKTNLFANLGDTSKGDLISQIVGLDFVDSMRDYSKKQKSDLKKEYIKGEGILSEKEAILLQLNTKLKKLQANDSSNKVESINFEISKIKNQLTLLEEDFNQKSYNNLEEIDTSELSKEYYSLQSKYENIKSKKLLLESNLSKSKTELKEAISGKCPTCKQDLHNKDLINTLKEAISKDFSYLKNLDNLDDLESELTIKHNKLLESQSINKKVALYRNEEKAFNKKSSELNNKILELEKQLLIEDTDTKLIEDVKSEIQSIEISIEECHKNQIALQDKIKNWNYLESKLFKRNGNLVQELNRQGSELIQSCINEVLYGLDINIKIDRDLQLSGKFHNKLISYGGMSSGQKRLTDITLMVSLNNLFSKIYNLEHGVLGLAVYDEILSFLDEKYIDYAKQIVDQSISNKILVITHDNKLMNMYDSKIKVSLSNTGSLYNKSWI